MFILTVDQIDSRNDHDRARELVTALLAEYGEFFILPPDQTAGDEVQVMLEDARATLDVVLTVHRMGHWSVGLGLGNVRAPLPTVTRHATGSGFVAARDAVSRAKKTEARFALTTPIPAERLASAGSLSGDEVEALITMLLLTRQRRTDEGWEAVDLVQQGLSQVGVARQLGISTAAVSQRVKAALWRVEQAVQPALVRLLKNLDRATSETESAA
jgi:DNA-binding NarL/FixJ family response regulator